MVRPNNTALKLAYRFIWQWDVDELVQPAWPENGWVYDVWSVRGTNNKHILLGRHAVHLSQDLVDHTICCSTYRSKSRSQGINCNNHE